ncbi:2-keto-4-pentenoate hydratase [Microlunatus sp. Gsoil 973]|uniref:2-keto-4-pentenoate hydratase n=1 Tax=Microlunatus sp. Gsoil 973 TaxID=2672569 RepID=UPI0012B4E8BE|nr:2-keto-4-pentenoate hydratase [Microlunatus sp. Gsoil 973]QGN32669.1 2-keto-4-pentenoate hydratase [Microlunatus sp. Gsoil 973]
MDVSSVAQTFVAARRAGTAVDQYPGRELPADLAEAYAVQDAAIALWGEEPAGWKAGLIAPERRQPGGDERLIGPIWQHAIRDSGSHQIEMPVFDGGFAAIEAEFVVRLDVDAAAGSWTAADAAELPQTLFAGIEIASSPFPKINDLGPAVTASDFGNNGGMIIGPQLPPDVDPSMITVRTLIDDDVAGEGSGATVPGGLATAVAQTLTILGRRHRSVPAGTFIATGATTGVHACQVGTSAVITFADLEPMRCRLVAAGPTS